MFYRHNCGEQKSLNFLKRVLEDLSLDARCCVTPLVSRQLSADDTIELELQPDKGIDLLCAQRDTGLVPGHSVLPEQTQQPLALLRSFKDASCSSLLSVYKRLNMQTDSLNGELLFMALFFSLLSPDLMGERRGRGFVEVKPRHASPSPPPASKGNPINDIIAVASRRLKAAACTASGANLLATSYLAHVVYTSKSGVKLFQLSLQRHSRSQPICR